jgi:hypothetical protein
VENEIFAFFTSSAWDLYLSLLFVPYAGRTQSSAARCIAGSGRISPASSSTPPFLRSYGPFDRDNCNDQEARCRPSDRMLN